MKQMTSLYHLSLIYFCTVLHSHTDSLAFQLIVKQNSIFFTDLKPQLKCQMIMQIILPQS